jgi:diaminopropionate ammonia-lyase
MEFLRNTTLSSAQQLTEVDQEMFGIAAPDLVRSYLLLCPRHAATPLCSLGNLAANLGYGGVFVKDEGQRLGLGSFKALGGAYAVIRIVVAHAENNLGRSVDPSELRSEAVARFARDITVACATDGNHGRSVAAGAALANCRAIIFVHEGVSDARVAAIEAFGAKVVRVSGRYDDSVMEARRVSEENGWQLVSDTSQGDYEQTPLMIMQGYTVLMAEALEQMSALGRKPSHVILQAGVGGFAAASAAYLTESQGPRRPTIIVVEPERANCVLEAFRAGRAVRIETREPTVMSMLESYESSHVALRILKACADAFMTISDDFAVTAMRRFAAPSGEDVAIVSGESGAAGLGGLLALAQNPAWRQQIGLGPSSDVLIVNTETATDAERYAQLVGLQPDQVGLARERPTS